MSIIDESGQTIMRVGMIHKLLAAAFIGLVSAQTGALLLWGTWVTSTVSQHSIDLAVLRGAARASADSGMSQSVQVGSLLTAEQSTPGTARDYLTTAELAERERVSERAIIEWIAQGRIEPAPIKHGKVWVIAASCRILPQDAAEFGTLVN